MAVGWWRGWAEKKYAVAVGGEGGDRNNVDNVRASGTGYSSTAIASRQLLQGGDFRAQHSSEAMFAAIAFVGAAVAAVARGCNVDAGTGGGVVGGGNSGARWRVRFPGPARIVRPNMHEHLVVIFGLMAKHRVHLELGARSAQTIASWQSVFDQYFNPLFV